VSRPIEHEQEACWVLPDKYCNCFFPSSDFPFRGTPKKIIHLVYNGENHYDLLVPNLMYIADNSVSSRRSGVLSGSKQLAIDITDEHASIRLKTPVKIDLDENDYPLSEEHLMMCP
jgi:hypothetical protein